MLVIRAVDQEADESLHARADEKAVDVRQVIAHEQRRSARRHVLLADDADAVDRVRQQPQAEADEELRARRPARRRSTTSVSTPNTRMIRSALSPRTVMHSHSAPAESMIADHVQEVVGRHQPAFFLLAAPLLQQRIERDREQAAEEPDQRQVDRRQRERVAGTGEQHGEHAPSRSLRSARGRARPCRRTAGRPPGCRRRSRSRRTSSGSPAQRALSAITSCRTESSRAAAARRGTRSTRCR